MSGAKAKVAIGALEGIIFAPFAAWEEALKLATKADDVVQMIDKAEDLLEGATKGSKGFAHTEEFGTLKGSKGVGRADEYISPAGGGGITTTIKINGKTIDFGHGGRHLEGTGLNIDTVNQALAKEVSRIHPGTGQFYKGQIVVDGITIEYTSYGVRDGVINIGTYYPLN